MASGSTWQARFVQHVGRERGYLQSMVENWEMTQRRLMLQSEIYERSSQSLNNKKE